jgi:uncharacterized phage-associated protein
MESKPELQTGEALGATFDEKAATQAAAFFLSKAGGRLNLMKLIKLLYFADREAIAARGVSITGDDAYAMDNGPVLTRIYDLMKGALIRTRCKYWSEHISERDGFDVSLMLDPGSASLSEIETEILGRVWDKLGRLDQWELSRLSHALPEWSAPDGSSRRIPLARILEAMGVPKEKIVEFERQERESLKDREEMLRLIG